MSAPKRALRDAEEISYGFLAARASSALTKVIRSQQLSEEEIAVLSRATSFLTDIADGVRLTSKGEISEGVRPSRSIAALDVAFGPMESLRDLVKTDHREIEPMFRRFSDAVAAVKSRTDVGEQLQTISEAQQFFEGLSGWLSNEIATRKRSSLRARARSHQ